jgi:hypothetical protein
MKTTYSVTLEGVLPVTAKVSISARSEPEAIMLAERIAESQRKGVRTAALQIQPYPISKDSLLANKALALLKKERATVETRTVERVKRG